MNTFETNEMLKAILSSIDEGIHAVDSAGITVFYNDVAGRLDGLRPEEVADHHVLDVFPSLTKETSTLLKVLATGRAIINQEQTYTNRNGVKINTINSTLPVTINGQVIGAVEVAKDYTKIRKLSEKLIDLQAKNLSGKKEEFADGEAYFTFDRIVSSDKAMLDIMAAGKKVSATSSPVLVYGETGTGKEMLVQAIHNHSPRKNKPFIAQNCAAIPQALLEGILFGTVKGGFTGSIDRPGIFELADGGTLFLDELNSMPPDIQSKLLRVLQEGVVTRVGGVKGKKIDVRVTAALNENPEKCMKNGTLRSDLYYRLNVIYFELPPLRQRKSDIPLLADVFLSEFERSFSKVTRGFSSDTSRLLLNHDWKGNVRELKHAVECAMNMVDDHEQIEIKHLPAHIQKADIAAVSWLEDGQASLDYKHTDLKQAVQSYELKLISEAVKEAGGNIQQAAKLLKIPRQTLQYKLKQV